MFSSYLSASLFVLMAATPVKRRARSSARGSLASAADEDEELALDSLALLRRLR